VKADSNEEDLELPDSEDLRVSPRDLETTYKEFIDFEKQKKAEINSKKLDLLRNIMMEKGRVKAIEAERERVRKKIELTEANVEEFKAMEEGYLDTGVQLLKEQKIKQEGSIYIFLFILCVWVGL
jgi:hypothetical protein